MEFSEAVRLVSDQWITVHPNGKGTKGTPVEIDGETGEVLHGMGGKYNGKHISEAYKDIKKHEQGASAVIAKSKASVVSSETSKAKVQLSQKKEDAFDPKDGLRGFWTKDRKKLVNTSIDSKVFVNHKGESVRQVSISAYNVKGTSQTRFLTSSVEMYSHISSGEIRSAINEVFEGKESLTPTEAKKLNETLLENLKKINLKYAKSAVIKKMATNTVARADTKTVYTQSKIGKMISDYRESLHGVELNSTHYVHIGSKIADDFDKSVKQIGERHKKNLEILADKRDTAGEEFDNALREYNGVSNKIGIIQADLDFGSSNADRAKQIEQVKELNKRLAEINARVKECKKAMYDLDEEIKIAKSNKKAESIKTMREFVGQIRPVRYFSEKDMGQFIAKGSDLKTYNSVANALSAFPAEWIESQKTRGLFKTHLTSERGEFEGKSPDGVDRVYIDSNKTGQESERISCVIHELSHRLETCHSGVLKAEEEFYKQRTKGEPLELLSKVTGNPRYTKEEKTRKDNFIHPYIGKDYEGEAYELISMGFETFFTEPEKLDSDKEYKHWLLGLVAMI